MHYKWGEISWELGMAERGGVSFGDMTGQKKGRDFSIHQDEIERTSIDLCLEGKTRGWRKRGK